MHTALLCIVLIISWWIQLKNYLRIFLRVASLALGQSYDCPRAIEATLKDISESIIIPRENPLEQSHNLPQLSMYHVHNSWDVLYIILSGTDHHYVGTIIISLHPTRYRRNVIWVQDHCRCLPGHLLDDLHPSAAGFMNLLGIKGKAQTTKELCNVDLGAYFTTVQY